VSGSLAMPAGAPTGVCVKRRTSVSLSTAGEAENHFEEIICATPWNGTLKSLYRFTARGPAVARRRASPMLPRKRVKPHRGTFERRSMRGRGCPFQCSFCTIINVQGRKSRRRFRRTTLKRSSATNLAQGINHFSSPTIISARKQGIGKSSSKRLIQLREKGRDSSLSFTVQVDTMCPPDSRVHREGARAPASLKFFLGLESINPREPDACAQEAETRSRSIARCLLQLAGAKGSTTYADTILGFPGDTAGSS